MFGVIGKPARRVIATAATVALVLLEASAVQAQGRSLIRDAEIESIIRGFATPLFQAAGLTPDAVSIFIIKDDSLNAFVAGGQNLFLNTGLLLEMQSPGELAGVLAHETGHIAGGHLARSSDAIGSASDLALLSTVLGVAAAVASGRPDAGTAIALGGQSVAGRSFLQYSRAQESAADQAALRYLEATGQSASGLARFLEALSDQELLSVSRQSPYLRTHPLTRERIAAVEAHIAASRFSDVPPSRRDTARFDRLVAKLHAFIRPPAETFRRYPQSDTSLPARLARAVAYRKVPDYARAIALSRALVADFPDDPYLHELEGQLLFEDGSIADAVDAYRRALDRVPTAGSGPGTGLIELSLAQALLALNRPDADRQALEHLLNARRAESASAFFWRQLATAQGRLGQLGDSALSLAEEAARQGRWRDAEVQAKRAQSLLTAGSSAMVRALDIENLASRERSER